MAIAQACCADSPSTANYVHSLASQPISRPRPFVSPLLLLCRRMIEAAVYDAVTPRDSVDHRRRSQPPPEATEPRWAMRCSAAWVRRPGDEPGSFSWAAGWLGWYACSRGLLQCSTSPRLPAQAGLVERLHALPERDFVDKLRRLLLEFIGECWRSPSARSAWRYRVRLSPAQIEEIRRRAALAERFSEIAASMGITRPTVAHYAAGKELPRPVVVAPEVRAEAMRLHHLGAARKGISAATGLSDGLVKRLILEMPADWSCPDVTAAQPDCTKSCASF